ncbi:MULTISPECIES: hypothetical protein [unclassified Nocardioides]|uniref:hypothetical protein n=1 Tax=unclassified Nocardioides TaxID=2615069 RepID=UPI0010548E00|nr:MULTISPECIES: hypothetical protein [unclassified Nocardioides]
MGALFLAAILVACGSDDGSTAVDPGGHPSPPAAMPTDVPAAPGVVDTRGLVTVMDAGGSPELCLGPVAESYPPQCSGPPIDGWDWSDHKQMYESQGSVRWGQFMVSGTWDGTTFGFENAVPGPLYDPMPTPEPTYPAPSVEHSRAELEQIAEEVGTLPGAQGAYADRGHVLVDVTYDDGSLQDWADETYGDGVVVVSPMLLDRAV